MYQLLDLFKILFKFAFDVLNIPLDFWGVKITTWEVFIFVFLGSILFGFVVSVFTGSGGHKD